jgi:cysteine desulfurase
MKKVYLDYNATTPIDPRVLEEMMPYLTEYYGNPSSIHSFGRKGKEALDKAREQVSLLISANPKEIIFTSGGSESANFAIKSTALKCLSDNKNHLITTKVEHECVLESFMFLERQGFEVTYLDVDSDGLIDIDLNKIPADLLSISAHKFYGPKSVGALFVRDSFSQNISLAPLIHGGGQERGKRSGTENVPGIVGLGVASKIALEEMENDQLKIRNLRDALLQSLKQNITDIKLNGSIENMLGNTLNLSILGAQGESLAMNLDIEGVAVSTGSACSEGAVDPSHVLSAMGLSREAAASSIRISLGRFTEKEDVDYAASIFPKVVERIRCVK